MKARNNAKYPWADWFRGRTFRLVEGVHFACGWNAMRIQVYTAARKHLPDRQVHVLAVPGPPATLDVRVGDARQPRRRTQRARSAA